MAYARGRPIVDRNTLHKELSPYESIHPHVIPRHQSRWSKADPMLLPGRFLYPTYISCIGCNRRTVSHTHITRTCSFDTSSLVKTFAISSIFLLDICSCYFIHNSVQPSLMNQFSLHKCRILNMRNICVWWNVSSQSF